MRILAAYDGSPSAEAAIDAILERPWPEGTQVRVVTVVTPPIPSAVPLELDYAPLAERVHAALRAEAREGLRRVRDRFKTRPDLAVSDEIREGSPKASLLGAIQEWKADLVFAGSHGARGLERLFLGSVCHALVTHSPCSIEVVKTPARRDGDA